MHRKLFTRKLLKYKNKKQNTKTKYKNQKQK